MMTRVPTVALSHDRPLQREHLATLNRIMVGRRIEVRGARGQKIEGGGGH
jgi:hypothetical protein